MRFRWKPKTHTLKGRRVAIQISDPYELPDAKLHGLIINEGVYINPFFNSKYECVLVVLDHPFIYDHIEYTHVSASPRHVGSPFKKITKQQTVPTNGLFINPSVNLESTWHEMNPNNGLGFIGSIL